MDEEIKGNQRSVFPGSTNQDSEGKGNSFFQRNGRDHFTFNSKTVITWGLLCSLGGMFLGSISVYKRFTTAISESIANDRPLNKKLDEHDWEIKNIKESIGKQDKNIDSLYEYVKAKGKK